MSENLGQYVSADVLKAGMETIRQSPRDVGTLEMIVTRPAVDERVMQESGELSVEQGLVGDDWLARGSPSPDGSAELDAQITLMNARVIDLIAGERKRWPLAGDQLFIDLDLSQTNLAPGQRLRIGGAILEVTPLPHTGCKKFSGRFGVEALAWASTPEGRAMRLRGMYARVVQPGTIRAGDAVIVEGR